MKRNTGRRLLLTGLLMGLLVLLTACNIPQDDINTNNITVGTSTVPFQTLAPKPTATPTPLPTAVPTPTVGGSTNQGGTGSVVTISPNINWGTNPTRVPEDTAAPGTTQSSGGTGEIQVVTGPPADRETAAPAVTTPPTISGTLRQGTKGETVRLLQQRLKDLGYYSGKVDGDFGSGTVAAVRLFQAANGLTADGIAGTQTIRTLFSTKAIPASEANVTLPPATSRTTATPRPTATPKPRVTPKPTPRPTATPNLSRARYLTTGSSGKDVRMLQQRLIDLGWMVGSPDGEYKGATEAAVKAFQKKMKIWDDGIAGPDTQSKLYGGSAAKSSTPVSSVGLSLKLGSQGSAVRALQRRIISLGYLSGTADGTFGASTQSAVEAFQRAQGLNADGVAGTATLNAIYSSGSEGNAGGKTNSTIISSTGYSTLREGDTGDGVRKLQQALKNKGYYAGSVDGSYGNGTTAAVAGFQQRNNLNVDGVAGPATQRLLFDAGSANASYSTLRETDEGSAVRNLQYTLYELGYFDGKVNGIYGATTTDAVRAFQQANRITPVDGVAGAKTLQKLYSSSAVASAAATSDYVTLRKGATGDEVIELQDVLSQLGYLGGISGVYDDATLSAVKAFQQRNGLNADGIAGASTQQKLYSDNPVPASGL